MDNPPESTAAQPAPMPILVVRRTIAAPAARLFEAWTQADQLRQWWGPPGVRCIDAQVDLRVGGGYRIGNQLPTGQVVWISGVFETVLPSSLLVYSWHTDHSDHSTQTGPSNHSEGRERVTVRFTPLDDGATEVVVEHQRIAGVERRESHERGWVGCLDGLSRFFDAEPRA